MKIRRTYKYRLYRCDKRDQYLHQQIDIAGAIWNHALALQKRTYRLSGRYITLYTMQKHIAKLRMTTTRYAFWKQLGSQAVQDVLQRLDAGYQRFFSGLAKRPPKYKMVRQRKSFTLKQVGYKLLTSSGNQIKIGAHVYKFVKHRQLQGAVRTVTVKRDAAHRLWLLFSVVEEIDIPKQAASGKIAGFDFGLKTFLTDHTGKQYISGLYHLYAWRRLGVLQSRKDKKLPGSISRRKVAHLIARAHIRVADKRRDAHFKLAHELCDTFDVLCFEDLNIDGMKRLWGRKVSDLAFYQFMNIVKQVAAKRGKAIRVIGRWERTMGKCSNCGHVQAMELRERTFQCGYCGLVIDRDHNAAVNIQRAGASAQTNRETVSRAGQTARSLV